MGSCYGAGGGRGTGRGGGGGPAGPVAVWDGGLAEQAGPYQAAWLRLSGRRVVPPGRELAGDHPGVLFAALARLAGGRVGELLWRPGGADPAAAPPPPRELGPLRPVPHP